MAITYCSECNRKVSTKATACPHCGGPIEISEYEHEVRKISILRVILTLAIWSVIGFGIYKCTVYIAEYEPPPDKFSETHIDVDKALNTCREYVLLVANHPSSVNFQLRGGDLKRDKQGKTQIIMVFTAKNSFNMETKNKIICLFDKFSLIDTLITEIN